MTRTRKTGGRKHRGGRGGDRNLHTRWWGRGTVRPRERQAGPQKVVHRVTDRPAGPPLAGTQEKQKHPHKTSKHLQQRHSQQPRRGNHRTSVHGRADTQRGLPTEGSPTLPQEPRSAYRGHSAGGGCKHGVRARSRAPGSQGLFTRSARASKPADTARQRSPRAAGRRQGC